MTQPNEEQPVEVTPIPQAPPAMVVEQPQPTPVATTGQPVPEYQPDASPNEGESDGSGDVPSDA